MGNENVVYTYKGILFNLEKEGHATIGTNIDKFWRHDAKQNKPVTKGQILYNFTYMRYLK